MDLVVALQDAHALARDRVAEIAADDWERSTPCPDWNVGQVALHLVVGMEWYDALLTGGDNADVPARLSAIRTTPDTAAGMLDEASVRLLTRFDHISLGKPIPYPGLEPFAGGDLARFSVFECCVHSWDLAQALGVDGTFSEEVAQIGYDGAVPFIGRIRETGITKLPTADQPSGDSAQARLLHLFGRTP